MKVMWIVNTIFPYPATVLNQNKTVFGGWLPSLYESLKNKKDINFAIVTTYKGEYKKMVDDCTTYYLLPEKNSDKYNKSLYKYWDKIVEEFEPDIVHIHGTEYPKGLTFMDRFPEIKTIISIQGLVSNVADVYYGNIKTSDLIKSISFRDIVKFNTIFSSQKDFAKRSVYEKKMLEKSKYVIGKSFWDEANVLAFNSKAKYQKINEILRSSFYTDEVWNIKKIQRHSLFCSQASYPIKGLHILLESMAILKKDFPDIKLYVSGSKVVDNSSFKNKLKRTGYGKYINNLIRKHNLESNIEFIGMLNADEVVKQLLQTHVYISPSFIENESNSLSEASILGLPVVGSYVGGVAERIINNESGFSYPATESAMLAYHIKTYFENDDICIKYGLEARKRYLKINSIEKNSSDIMKFYQDVNNN